jgi:hypothetical protein
MMQIKSILILIVVVTSLFCSVANSQSVFPRDGNEVLAMRIHNKYVQSRVLLAQLETARDKTKGFISEVAPASTMVGTAIDPDDTNRLNALNSLIATEIDRLHKLEAAWDSNRATANGPIVTFAGRYGPLSSSFEKSTANPNYGKIEYAIRTFPFISKSTVSHTESPQETAVVDSSRLWGGRWNLSSQYVSGALELTQSGASVSGRYENGKSFGHVQGTINGNTLSGTWSDPNNGNSGPFKWVLDAGGRAFSGSFSWQGNSYAWNGNR